MVDKEETDGGGEAKLEEKADELEEEQ